MSKRIHLICNAHIDPVWQWEWEEGAAETLSTFQIAADFCEEFDHFVFCHNEVLTAVQAGGKYILYDGNHVFPCPFSGADGIP